MCPLINYARKHPANFFINQGEPLILIFRVAMAASMFFSLAKNPTHV